jgi:hypothetical protein
LQQHTIFQMSCSACKWRKKWKKRNRITVFTHGYTKSGLRQHFIQQREMSLMCWIYEWHHITSLQTLSSNTHYKAVYTSIRDNHEERPLNAFISDCLLAELKLLRG